MPVWKVMQVYWVVRIVRWVWRAVAERRAERKREQLRREAAVIALGPGRQREHRRLDREQLERWSEELARDRTEGRARSWDRRHAGEVDDAR